MQREEPVSPEAALTEAWHLLEQVLVPVTTCDRPSCFGFDIHDAKGMVTLDGDHHKPLTFCRPCDPRLSEPLPINPRSTPLFTIEEPDTESKSEFTPERQSHPGDNLESAIALLRDMLGSVSAQHMRACQQSPCAMWMPEEKLLSRDGKKLCYWCSENLDACQPEQALQHLIECLSEHDVWWNRCVHPNCHRVQPESLMTRVRNSQNMDVHMVCSKHAPLLQKEQIFRP